MGDDDVSSNENWYKNSYNQVFSRDLLFNIPVSPDNIVYLYDDINLLLFDFTTIFCQVAGFSFRFVFFPVT